MRILPSRDAVAVFGFLVIGILSTAISGGPNYGAGKVSVTGNYAGVLSPASCSASPTPSPPARCGANSVGIFSIDVPKTGTATGPLVIFDEGQAYVGTIQGTGDPGTGQITGLIEGHFTFQEQVITSTEDTTDTNGTTHHKVNYATQSFSATAAGQMSAKAKAATGISLGATRLSGNADVQFSLTVNTPFDEIAYRVVGFKQQ